MSYWFKCKLISLVWFFMERKSDKKTIKILQIHPSFAVATAYVGDQVSSALEKENYDVVTAFMSGPPPDGVGQMSDKVHCFNFSSWFMKGVFRWFVSIIVLCYIKKNKFDLIIVHRFKPIHILLLANRLLKIPVIGIVHGLGDYDRSYRQKNVKTYVSGKWSFVAVSDEVKKYLVDLSCGFSERNTHVITNAIDIIKINHQQLSRDEARKALGVPKDVFLFGTVGRLVPVKGYQYLIKAMGKLHSQFSKAQVVIVGDGRMKGELQSLIVDERANGSVILAGWKDGAARYVKAFDVFVISSLSEGMPLAMMEAMAGKVPVIASDIPSLKPFIECSGGWCFRSGDDGELASVMESVLHLTSSELNEVGEAAFSYILQEHSLERFSNEYRSLVSSQLAINS